MAGNATFTTVPSMNAMLEPKIAAVRIHAPCTHGAVASLAHAIVASSQGARTIAVNAGPLGVDACGSVKPTDRGERARAHGGALADDAADPQSC